MVRKKVVTKSNEKQNPEQMKKSRPKLLFLDVHLNERDKEELRQGWSPDPSPMEVLSYLVDQGYRISFGYDSYHDAAMVSLQGRDPERPNYNLMLSGRGATIKGAYLSLCYKHFVKREGGAWQDDYLEEEVPKEEFF